MMCIKTGDLPKKSDVTPIGGRTGNAGGRGWRGLSSAEAEISREENGRNILTRQKPKGFFHRFFENLRDPVIRILLIALALNLIFMFRETDWVETVGIAVSVLLATTISTVSEMGSEAAFTRLQEESERSVCRVVRDGGVRVIPWEDAVVGDVILLGAGERIPADGLLFDGSLRVDQAALTGESRELQKEAGGINRGEPGDGTSLFRGCVVLGGEGKMIVRAVGDMTLLGGISREVQEETRDSPLKLRLAKLAGQISMLGYVAAILVAAAFLFHAFVIDSGFRREMIYMKLSDFRYLCDTLLHALMLGLTVIVVAVPEGLPMMIAVVLSANTRRMVRDQVLVRKPAGIEAAGSMDLLFTDKTGTLTGGKLSVGEVISGDGTVFRDVRAFRAGGVGRFDLYRLEGYWNSMATVGAKESGSKGHAVGGNATDRAVTDSVAGEVAPDAELLARLPFDSARKIAATVIESREGRARGRLTLIKGAPEKLMRHCRYAYDGEGRAMPLDRAATEEQIRRRMAAGERVLLLAVVEKELSLSDLENEAFDGAVFLCALTLSDQIRPEAGAAVRALHGAGVQVVMITGDARETATQIAKECGILTRENDLVLSGDELATLSDFQLRELLPRLAVVARALPNDKSRLVRVAQEENRVVGMTGDGINDAPALRRADIGFAMGSGTAVAQEAGDILILDDNLASIVRAVLYGRNIFKSIRKFITLQLTMNFCAVGVSMIGPFIGVDAPVTVVQMLWINLIMDTLGGLAFAGEAALPSCLKEKPKKRDEPILCRYMINEIVLLGGYTVGLCLWFLKAPQICASFRAFPDDLCHLTAFFALFIFASVFNCFNARTDRLRLLSGIGGNRPFLFIMAAILVIQIVFVYLGGSVLRTMPLLLRELSLTAGLAFTVIPAEFVRKVLWRVRGRRGGY